MHQLIDIATEHPIAAFITSAIFTISSFVPTVIDMALPLILVQSFQIVACSVTITVGLLAILKHKKKDGHK